MRKLLVQALAALALTQAKLMHRRGHRGQPAAVIERRVVDVAHQLQWTAREVLQRFRRYSLPVTRQLLSRRDDSIGKKLEDVLARNRHPMRSQDRSL